ncbi:MAG: hypothetical protein KBA30_06670 [Clostridia bacterium]|nr:hypothetical protein [Clostridia bacterium]
MNKKNLAVMLLIIATISTLFIAGCSATDETVTFISYAPPAVRTEEGLARAMQGDYSDVFNPYGGGPNTKLAQDRIYSSFGISVFYYHPKQHPEKATLEAIYLYEGSITFGYTSTDPKNPTPETGEKFNITWHTKSSLARTQFNNWKQILPNLVESDEKSGYFYAYSETPGLETKDIDKSYAILWMQEGYCFMANMPARYGLEHILDLCDMEAVDITAQ